jgi:hypothetical protein
VTKNQDPNDRSEYSCSEMAMPFEVMSAAARWYSVRVMQIPQDKVALAPVLRVGPNV